MMKRNFQKVIHTCDASNDCHSEAVISDVFAKLANVSSNKPLRLGGMEQHTKPNNEATGNQFVFSQNATRTLSL